MRFCLLFTIGFAACSSGGRPLCINALCSETLVDEPVLQQPPPAPAAVEPLPPIRFVGVPPSRLFIGEPLIVRASESVTWHNGDTVISTGETLTYFPPSAGALVISARAGEREASFGTNIVTDDVVLSMSIPTASGVFSVHTDGTTSQVSSSNDLYCAGYATAQRGPAGVPVFLHCNGATSVRAGQKTLIGYFPEANRANCALPFAPTGDVGVTTCLTYPKIRVSRDGGHMLLNAYRTATAPSGPAFAFNSASVGGRVMLYDLNAPSVTASERVIATNHGPTGTLAVYTQPSSKIINDADVEEGGGAMLATWLEPGGVGRVQMHVIGPTGVTIGASQSSVDVVYDRPRFLGSNRVAFLQMASSSAGAFTPPTGYWRLAVTPEDLSSPAVIAASGSVDLRYAETGPFMPSGVRRTICQDTVTSGGLGVSLTGNLDYDVSPDGETLLVNQLSSVWEGCAGAFLTTAFDAHDHRLFLYDVATGASRNVLPAEIPVRGEFALSMAQFVAEGRQIVFAKHSLVLGGVVELWIANVDPVHPNAHVFYTSPGAAVPPSRVNACASGSAPWLLAVAVCVFLRGYLGVRRTAGRRRRN